MTDLDHSGSVAAATSALDSPQRDTRADLLAELLQKPAAPRAVPWYEPSGFDEARAVAKYYANSGLVPVDYAGNPEKCYVAMVHGEKMGVPHLSAIQNIVVIHGRPFVMGRLALGLALNHPMCDGKSESIEGEGADMVATCTLRRITGGNRIPPKVDEHVGRFSMQDAKRAGLVSKGGTYEKYQKDMLMWRARSRAIDAGFADVLLGLGVAENQEAEPEITPVDTGPTPAALAAAEAVKKATTEPKTMPQALKAIARASEAACIDSETLRDYVEDVYGPESPTHLPLAGLIEVCHDIETEKVAAWIAERIAKVPSDA